MTIIINSAPERADFLGLIAGTAWGDVAWDIGPEDSPTNLTGKSVRLSVRGVDMPVTVNNPVGRVTWQPTAAQTAALPWQIASYLLLIDGEPQVQGLFKVSSRVSP